MQLAPVISWTGCSDSTAVWRLPRIKLASCFWSAASPPVDIPISASEQVLSIIDRTHSYCDHLSLPSKVKNVQLEQSAFSSILAQPICTCQWRKVKKTQNGIGAEWGSIPL
jgi:hypothetical protein